MLEEEEVRNDLSAASETCCGITFDVAEAVEVIEDTTTTAAPTEAPDSGDGGGFPLWAIGIIIGIPVLVAIVVIVIILVNKKK